VTPEEGWNRLLRYIGHWAAFGYGMFAVMERASGMLVGDVGLADFHRGLGADFDPYPEAAWVLDASVQGRGMAAEAMGAVLNWARGRVGGDRTVCVIDERNDPSLRLAGRLGYVPFRETLFRGRDAVLLSREMG